MGRIGAFIIIKCVEFMLAIALWDTYGKAHDICELLYIFIHQPELSRVGTITCVVILSTTICDAIRAALERLASLLTRALVLSIRPFVWSRRMFSVRDSRQKTRGSTQASSYQNLTERLEGRAAND